MTSSQILQLVRAKILESTTDIITDDTLYLYANLTKEDIIKRAFPNNQITSATITFTSGVGTLPTNFGTLYGDAFKNIGNYFPELSIDDFQKQTLTQSVTIEGGTIKVYPTETASLTIKYYPTYPDISASVSPTFDAYFHEPIVYGVLARAYEDLQDPELASLNATKYENMLNQKIANQSNYEEGNQRGGQMFSEQDLLNGGTSFV
jgi:hypothetical protein